MGSPLKEMYSPAFFEALSGLLAEHLETFEKERFLQTIFTGEWEQRELKDRMHHTATAVHRFMPKDFPAAARIIRRITDSLKAGRFPDGGGFGFMFLPDYIETYGLEDYQAAVECIESTTQLFSCEFAVRPFILKYGERMTGQMLRWSRHENAMVRRLASEGMRPRLPWAIALPAFKKDPAPVLPILENLRRDPDESVRRSVANNLNDISKDNPDITVALARKWKGENDETDALVKHGCRTLLKSAHPEIMTLFGLDAAGTEFTDFRLETPAVAMEGDLRFAFSVANNSNVPRTVRIEYAIFHKRKNGEHNKKVFKISEKEYAPGETNRIVRRHGFQTITTRRYYPGDHFVSVIVNGAEQVKVPFELTEE